MGVIELPKEIEEKIIENNKKISELLKENENLAKKAGANPPMIQYANLQDDDMIRIPYGYIRDADWFRNNYEIEKICKDNKAAADNIVYAIETLDLYNFILNRIGIYGVVRINFAKDGIIKKATIMEQLLKKYIESVRKCCDNCSEKDNCLDRTTGEDTKEKLVKIIEIMKDKNLLNIEDISLYDKMDNLRKIRNKIHGSKLNELKEDEYNKILWNDVTYTVDTMIEKMKDSIDLYSDSSTCPLYKSKELELEQ